MNMNKEQSTGLKQASEIRRNSPQIILVFAAFLLMVLVSILFVRRIFWNRLMESAKQTLSSAEARIHAAFVESDIILLSLYHTVQDMIETEASQDDLRDYIATTTNWLEQYEGIFRLTGAYGYIRGEYLDSIFTPDDSYVPQTRPWYQAGMRSGREAAYTSPYFDEYSRKMVISAVRSVGNRDGGTEGIVAIDIIIDKLNDYLQGLKLTEDGYVMIISQDMMVAAHPYEELLGEYVEGLGPSFDDIAWRLRIGETISAKQIQGNDGKAALVFFSPLFNGWYVGLVTPQASFYQDLYDVGGILAGLGLVLAFCVSMVLLRLDQARVRSDEENRSKSSFLARMSHEIRTPMNAIIGMGELALQAQTLPKMTEYVGEIKQAGLNLLSLINDILDFSRIEAGNFQINNAPYDLSSLLNDVINVSRVRISEKPIIFTVFVDAAIPGRLSGDEVRFRQVLLNILSNAAKYTHEGSIALKVRTEPGDKQDLILVLEIADSGVGIKAADLPGIFGNFVRLDMEKNRNIEGTGLGLAITHSLCLSMGGDITVTSEYGKGSVFTARIPQTVVSSKPIAEVEDPQEKGVLIFDHRPLCVDSLSQTLENLGVPVKLVRDGGDFLAELESGNWPFAFVSPLCADAAAILKNQNLKTRLVLLADLGVSVENFPLITMPAYSVPVANVLNGKVSGNRWKKTAVKFTAPRAKVLIVDDVATNLKVAEGLLTPYRMEVHLAAGGREAVEMVKQRSYDIVFMDHMMPGMDGIEAAAAIRAWEAEQGNSRKPVTLVALTANAVSGMKEMFLEKGFNDYLSKPIEISKLNQLMGLWIPEEKREQSIRNREQGTGNRGNGPSLPVIPGLDTVTGITMTGGTLDGYRQVLSLFCKDVEERLPLLRNPPEEAEAPLNEPSLFRSPSDQRPIALSLFTTQVHALKSASASIGAAVISAEAAKLEAAGKAGDLGLIRKALPAFTEELAALAGNIRIAIETIPGSAAGSSSAPLLPSALLRELRQALISKKVEAIDSLLEEFDHELAGTNNRKSLDQISDAVLIAEYGRAADLVESLIERGEA